jgi:hypothetical protein
MNIIKRPKVPILNFFKAFIFGVKLGVGWVKANDIGSTRPLNPNKIIIKII